MTRRNVLIVGYGSIGARHARLAAELGHGVTVVSRRSGVTDKPQFPSVEAAIANGGVSHAIVANETSEHWTTVRKLRQAGFGGPILIEKPVTARLPAEPEEIAARGGGISVAYNLRFHPAIQLLKQRIATEPAISATLIAGQDLRAWRPGRSVEDSYSADPARGGGVLRDLSHEIDLFLWLFGPWIHLAAVGGQLGSLPIAADDCWNLLLTAERCRVASIQLDYYNRTGVRLIIVNTATGTITVDLVRHSYVDEQGERSWSVDRDLTYIAQLRGFLGDGEEGALCTLTEGLAAVSLIEAAEAASSTQSWIHA